MISGKTRDFLGCGIMCLRSRAAGCTGRFLSYFEPVQNDLSTRVHRKLAAMACSLD